MAINFETIGVGATIRKNAVNHDLWIGPIDQAFVDYTLMLKKKLLVAKIDKKRIKKIDTSRICVCVRSYVSDKKWEVRL